MLGALLLDEELGWVNMEMALGMASLVDVGAWLDKTAWFGGWISTVFFGFLNDSVVVNLVMISKKSGFCNNSNAF